MAALQNGVIFVVVQASSLRQSQATRHQVECFVQDSYLQVTFRHGRPIAAYYYLPRRAGEKSARTQSAGAGLLVDYSQEGKAIGIEITAPSNVTVEAVNEVLKGLGEKTIEPVDLASLHAA